MKVTYFQTVVCDDVSSQENFNYVWVNSVSEEAVPYIKYIITTLYITKSYKNFFKKNSHLHMYVIILIHGYPSNFFHMEILLLTNI